MAIPSEEREAAVKTQLAAASELLAKVQVMGLRAPILPGQDPRWRRLTFRPDPNIDLRDRFRGALLGGAIGDAMGRANEGKTADEARRRRVRQYVPWKGWQGGPKGTITDDTQMTMWLAEAILAAACTRRPLEVRNLGEWLIQPEDIANRFTRERIRGIGQATHEFVGNYKDLGRWWEAGVESAGNGTAMRAAPVGLVHLGDPYRIYRDSLLHSVITHLDSMAIAGAACQAYLLARAAMASPGSLACMECRLALCDGLAALLEGLERPDYQLRGGSGGTSLHARIGDELPRYLVEDRAPFDEWHNGAYVLESLPCALWCFLSTAEDFEETLFRAVDAGHDADTVAAMACSVSGAYHGESGLPPALLGELEYRDKLVELADGLHSLAIEMYAAAWAKDQAGQDTKIFQREVGVRPDLRLQRAEPSDEMRHGADREGKLRYQCVPPVDMKFPGGIRPPELYTYPEPVGPVELVLVGWNPPKPFGGFWSTDSPDNLRTELHRILKALGLSSAEDSENAFLEEFRVARRFFFVHAVKCWTEAKYPGFGRGAKAQERRDIGEPLLRACAQMHLGKELESLSPKRVCALGELAYEALRCLYPDLPAKVRPTQGGVFGPAQGRPWSLLYTCFPSRAKVGGKPLCDYTSEHLKCFFAQGASPKE